MQAHVFYLRVVAVCQPIGTYSPGQLSRQPIEVVTFIYVSFNHLVYDTDRCTVDVLAVVIALYARARSSMCVCWLARQNDVEVGHVAEFP